MCSHNNAKPSDVREPCGQGRCGFAAERRYLALSGCTVGPDFVRPEAKVNENWNEKSDPRVRQTADRPAVVESVP